MFLAQLRLAINKLAYFTLRCLMFECAWLGPFYGLIIVPQQQLASARLTRLGTNVGKEDLNKHHKAER